jgi:hypothetical protein
MLKLPFMQLTLLNGIQFPDKRRSCSLKLSTCVLKSDTRSFSTAFSRCIRKTSSAIPRRRSPIVQPLRVVLL